MGPFYTSAKCEHGLKRLKQMLSEYGWWKAITSPFSCDFSCDSFLLLFRFWDGLTMVKPPIIECFNHICMRLLISLRWLLPSIFSKGKCFNSAWHRQSPEPSASAWRPEPRWASASVVCWCCLSDGGFQHNFNNTSGGLKHQKYHKKKRKVWCREMGSV